MFRVLSLNCVSSTADTVEADHNNNNNNSESNYDAGATMSAMSDEYWFGDLISANDENNETLVKKHNDWMKLSASLHLDQSRHDIDIKINKTIKKSTSLMNFATVADQHQQHQREHYFSQSTLSIVPKDVNSQKKSKNNFASKIRRVASEVSLSTKSLHHNIITKKKDNLKRTSSKKSLLRKSLCKSIAANSRRSSATSTNKTNKLIERAYPDSSSFSVLPEEIQHHILSFSGPSEIRTMMCTSQSNLVLCRSQNIWMDTCKRSWNLLDELESQSDCNGHNMHIRYDFQDDLKISNAPSSYWKSGTPKKQRNFFGSKPLKMVTDSSSIGVAKKTFKDDQPNLSVLTQMSQPYPTKIDSLFLHSKEYENLFRSFSMNTTSEIGQVKGGVPVVQFMSAVGAGDRCIRSNLPFPHKDEVLEHTNNNSSTTSTRNSSSKWPSPFFHMASMMKHSGISRFLPPLKNKNFGTSKFIHPFVAPMVMGVNEEKTEYGKTQKTYTLNITPRLCAYFEITIHSRDTNQEPSPLSHREGNNASECIAIGLSSEKFNVTNKMPGWDKFSYGYHGDDGGIFHANGDMLRRYGPKFGVGDTVGCGIDYATRGIFFTLNGLFLGYAWLDLDLKQKLFPTIGIDTNCPVQVNFGTSPFHFDLRNHFKEQELSAAEVLFPNLPSSS